MDGMFLELIMSCILTEGKRRVKAESLGGGIWWEARGCSEIQGSGLMCLFFEEGLLGITWNHWYECLFWKTRDLGAFMKESDFKATGTSPSGDGVGTSAPGSSKASRPGST